MSYTKQNFVDGQKLTAAQLNHMEDGIYANSQNTSYTPKKGVDYWTTADITEIKSYVDDAILGGSW